MIRTGKEARLFGKSRASIGRRILLCLWVSAAVFSGVTGATALGEDADAPAAEATYRLQYRFRANQFVHFEVTQKDSVTVQKGEVKDLQQYESRTRTHYRVSYVDEQGNGILEPLIDRVRMTVRFGEDDLRSWDSGTGEKPYGPFQQVARTVGRPLLRLTVADDGRIISRTKLNSTRRKGGRGSRRAGSAGASPSPADHLLIRLPEEAVRIGETWRERFEIEVPVEEGESQTVSRPIRLLRQYTLTAVEGREATISSRTAALTPVADPRVLYRLALAKFPARGTVVFDLQEGVILSREIVCDERVIGFQGADSSLSVQSRRVEERIRPAVSARKPAVRIEKN